MKVAGILFDKDGTLIDFEATYASACARILVELAEGNAERAALLAEAAGFDLPNRRFNPDSIIIAGTAMTLALAWAGHLGIEADAAFARRIDNMFARHSADNVVLFEGAGDVLGGFAERGYPLGIATNDSEAGGRAHMQIAGISDHFSFFAGHDSGHGAKPGPGMVLAFAEHCGCAAGEIVMVGDSRHDLDAARAAGAVAVAVTTGLVGHAELAPHADHVIASLAELASLPIFPAA